MQNHMHRFGGEQARARSPPIAEGEEQPDDNTTRRGFYTRAPSSPNLNQILNRELPDHTYDRVIHRLLYGGNHEP